MVQVVRNLPVSARDVRDAGSIPGSGRSFGGGHGNPLQYSCLENLTDRGAWQATVHRVAKSQTWLRGLSFSSSSIRMTEILICAFINQKVHLGFSSNILNQLLGQPNKFLFFLMTRWTQCGEQAGPLPGVGFLSPAGLALWMRKIPLALPRVARKDPLTHQYHPYPLTHWGTWRQGIRTGFPKERGWYNLKMGKIWSSQSRWLGK